MGNERAGPVEQRVDAPENPMEEAHVLENKLVFAKWGWDCEFWVKTGQVKKVMTPQGVGHGYR